MHHELNTDDSTADFSDLSSPSIRFPRPFGNYLLLQVLARGGMGEVYLAKQGGIAGLEKYCVVKTLRSQHTADREYVARFMDEARVVVNLNHRNICQVFDVGRVGERYYLSMELVEGVDLRTLHEVLGEKGVGFAREQALHITCETLEALDYAHRQKDPLSGQPLHIVHRDVSPQNVMINFEGEVKLIDFGLAASTKKTEMTAPNIVMGKMAYMSPEQARGDAVDGRADLFATAVIAYEMLVGERFYEGLSPGDIWSVAGRGGFEPRGFAQLDPKIRKILSKALAPSLDLRFQTCAEFKEALQNFLFEEQLRTNTQQLRGFLEEHCADQQRQARDLHLRHSPTMALEFREPKEFTQSFAKSESSDLAPSLEATGSDKGVLPASPALSGPEKTERVTRAQVEDTVPTQNASRHGAPLVAILGALLVVGLSSVAGVLIYLSDSSPDSASAKTAEEVAPLPPASGNDDVKMVAAAKSVGELGKAPLPDLDPTPTNRPASVEVVTATEGHSANPTVASVSQKIKTKPLVEKAIPRRTREKKSTPPKRTSQKSEPVKVKSSRPALESGAKSAKLNTPFNKIQFLKLYCQRRETCAVQLIKNVGPNLTTEKIGTFEKKLTSCIRRCKAN